MFEFYEMGTLLNLIKTFKSDKILIFHFTTRIFITVCTLIYSFIPDEKLLLSILNLMEKMTNVSIILVG